MKFNLIFFGITCILLLQNCWYHKAMHNHGEISYIDSLQKFDFASHIGSPVDSLLQNLPFVYKKVEVRRGDKLPAVCGCVFILEYTPTLFLEVQTTEYSYINPMSFTISNFEEFKKEKITGIFVVYRYDSIVSEGIRHCF